MQVDFYQLTHDPAEKVLALLAQKTLDSGKRLLVVSAHEEQLAAISTALWSASPDSFLAHDFAGSPKQTEQPILLNDTPQNGNKASFIALADGEWRDEATGFERAFYLFGRDELDAARATWRRLGEDESITRKFWKQDGGRWVEGP
ncbi:DNA polymerase III subunit chi [Sphingorhabdus sp. Alg239-R122]|uniref:DNA polymerase III subunit chi n=1 Tax=Sphingorhabdus sp. Alg239-R122 TaxID=2305989 RepID=UPI0013D99FF3|nr:DNA polymerase III subunit chi [Sphingorhabdus sp. Alg239-R122]